LRLVISPISKFRPGIHAIKKTTLEITGSQAAGQASGVSVIMQQPST
jgi:hypothetical protein